MGTSTVDLRVVVLDPPFDCRHLAHGLLEDALESGARLVCEMNGTNARNEPATGTIRPSALSWHIE